MPTIRVDTYNKYGEVAQVDIEPDLMNPWLRENQPADFDQWSQLDRDDWFQQVQDANNRAVMDWSDPAPWWLR